MSTTVAHARLSTGCVAWSTRTGTACATAVGDLGFELLASTGLRISEAIALRIMDVDLAAGQPQIHVRRAIVDGQLTGPKSWHGRRTIPISHELAERLAELAVDRHDTALLFVGAQGAVLRPGNLRYRVMIPAAERASVP